MNRIWRIILVMMVILIMGITVITSVNNGSPVGNFMKESGIIQNTKRKYGNIMKEALDIKIAPMP